MSIQQFSIGFLLLFYCLIINTSATNPHSSSNRLIYSDTKTVDSKQCQYLKKNLSTGAVHFTTISQLFDGYLYFTADNYDLNLPVANFHPTPPHPLHAEIQFKDFLISLNEEAPSEKFYLTLQFNTTTDSLWLLALNDTNQQLASLELDLSLTYINSPKDHTIFVLNTTSSSIIKVTLNGTTLRSSPSQYLCNHSEPEKLLLSTEPCANQTTFTSTSKLINNSTTFSGLISRRHLYLLTTDNSVIIIEWPELLKNSTKVVGFTEVQLIDSLICNEEPSHQPVVQRLNWKHYFLYPLLGLFSLLLILSLAYWAYLYYTLNQAEPEQGKVKVLLKKEDEDDDALSKSGQSDG